MKIQTCLLLLCLFHAPFTSKAQDNLEIEGVVKDENGDITDYSGLVLHIQEGPRLPKSKKNPAALTVNQVNKKFSPAMIPLEIGDSVSFSNKDDIFHNVFSSDLENKFDLGVYKGSSKYSEDKKTILEGDFKTAVQFKKGGKVHIFCNIHQNMMATAYVFNHSYFTAPAKDGLFKIKSPRQVGEYHLVLEGDGISSPVVHTFKLPLKERLIFSFKSSSSAKKIIPHKKKNGEEYKSSTQGQNTDDYY